MRRLLSLALVASACTHAPPAPPPPAPAPDALRFDLAALDRKADPCVDFYQYACGGWLASHPIPPDRARWSRYGEMEARNLERVKAIVAEAEKAGPEAPEAERRIGALYGACMDEARVEARGLEPLRPLLARIDAAQSREALLELLADLQAHGVRALLDAWVWADPHDARRMLLTLDRGFLGMPSRDDYASPDPRAARLREGYRAHLVRVFGLLEPGADAGAEADRVIALETALAARALSPVEARDPDAQYHPLTPAQLQARYPHLGLPALLARMGAPGLEQVNVAVPPWLEGVDQALAGDLAPVRAYLRATLARTFAPQLPRALEAERFDFEQRLARGIKEQPPRWKRCLGLLESSIGDDVGRLFLARHFDAQARARAEALVAALRAAYARELAEADWLSPATRAAAQAKLARLLVVVGGSNRPHRYQGLALSRDDLFGDVWRARAHEARRELGLLGKPTDREEFFTARPQSLDGFSEYALGGLGFTAGFLQPPVFDPAADDAVNYGGVGGVIGHELNHQFDDAGRKYDAEGNLRPWWSAAEVAAYQERAACFVEEYAAFRAQEGTPLDGKLTLGENLGDNGGLRLAYDALRPSAEGPLLEGFTPAQRFFLAWGQIRCENVTPEAARRQALTDEHAPGRFRVNGVVSNLPGFARAFACQPGAPMVREKACRVW